MSARRANAATSAASKDSLPASTQRWVLVGMLGAVLLNVQHIAPWCVPVALGAAAWRLWAPSAMTQLRARTMRVAIAAVLTLAVLVGFRTLNGLDAGASLLVAMAALKLLETRGARDWLVVIGASLFLLMAACLDAQDLWRAPVYAAELWLLCTALYALGNGASAAAPAALLRSSSRSLLLAVPFAIVLFLFFPRLPGSLWSIPRDDEAVTGLGEQMSPGSISQLIESHDAALHVRFEGPPPPPAQRYWRGPVLHDFDGYTWRRSRGAFGPPAPVEFAGASYRYEITLEPSHHRVLIALELPSGLPQQVPLVTSTFDYQLIGAQPITSAISYQLESFPLHRNTQPLQPALRRADLALPRARNPRTLELAQSLRARASDDRGYIDAVLDYLRRGGFKYSLTPPRLNADSIDELLFKTRQGFCGHYASAFATLMRAGGIPARVVTGYLGGEWNRFGGYLLVRQSDAHAWTEVWLEGSGWIRVDPTAIVAPERLTRGLDDVLTSASGAPRRLRAPAWISSTVQAWQAMNAWWQDEFIEFNTYRQFNLLGALGFKDRDWEALVTLLAVGGALWLALLAWRERRHNAPRRQDRLGRYWHALERKLRRRGTPRAPYEGPVAYCERIARAHPEFGAALTALARNYARMRYGPSYSEERLQRFRRAVQSFTTRHEP